ncbi:alpha-galactosidase [Oceanispirochaeta crateris]|nr:alpha-galactosidase [Oceanispirochaeta crateris]
MKSERERNPPSMIHYNKSSRQFHLQTKASSYVLQILETGHLAHLYFGKKIRHRNDFENFIDQKKISYGSTTSYNRLIDGFSLQHELLEYSSYGKGDYRNPSISLLSNDGNRTFDFIYQSHQIFTGKKELDGLPSSYAYESEDVQSLELILEDKCYELRLILSYSIFHDKDVISRSVSLQNRGKQVLIIDKISSFSLDFDKPDFDLVTLDGSWIRERFSHRRALNYGMTEISSRRGVSGSDHNPFILLCDSNASEISGNAYGFALIYSGNHSSSVEVNTHDKTRIQMGINDFDFSWKLNENEIFQSPEALLVFSDKGINGISSMYHRFIRFNIVRGPWQFKERPILFNNWEATYFKFNEKKLLSLAKEAKALGMELFVLDDGWFGKREDDHSSLGDWTVNLKKLPGGLKGLGDKIKKTGLDFGIWVEPEMISIESELYKQHPEWMIQCPMREPSPARNQFILDLANPLVCEYICESMKSLFSSADISYVKWDMNRNFSDIYSHSLKPEQQKEFSHRYVLGLYGILKELTEQFPHILFESCASGGNRFDLAMFCFMPQIWTSDNTDAMERLHIQSGSSLFAPTSVMGAHVSAVPNHQVLRNTPIESRFNTAAFGLLGYELDLSKITNFEKKVIKKQIAFYKEHRKLLQFGTFYRIKAPSDRGTSLWMIVSEDQKDAILGYYQQLAQPNPPSERYLLEGLNPDMLYEVQNRTQFMDIRQFGDLINQALPVSINTEGILHSKIAENYLYELEKTEFKAFGDQLMFRGFVPKQQFYGTGLDDHCAFLGDFGSRLFILRAVED